MYGSSSYRLAACARGYHHLRARVGQQRSGVRGGVDKTELAPQVHAAGAGRGSDLPEAPPPAA